MGCGSSKEAQADGVSPSQPRRLHGGTHVLGSGDSSAPKLTPVEARRKAAEERAAMAKKNLPTNNKLLRDMSAQNRQQRDVEAGAEWRNYN